MRVYPAEHPPAVRPLQLAAGSASAPSALPALQELRGSWGGSVQAYGGAGGSTAVDFQLKGSGWQWGEWTLDHVGGGPGGAVWGLGRALCLWCCAGRLRLGEYCWQRQCALSAVAQVHTSILLACSPSW